MCGYTGDRIPQTECGVCKRRGPLLAETVTENFKINVDRYMAVSFKDMIDIIDAVGAISITFTEKEAANANQTMEHMCQNMNIEDRYPEYMIPGGRHV